MPCVPRGALTRAAVLEPQVSAHSGDSVRALCSVLAAIAVVLPSMRCQLPLQHAGAGLGGQTAPPARLQAPVVPCRAGGRTALLYRENLRICTDFGNKGTKRPGTFRPGQLMQ